MKSVIIGGILLVCICFILKGQNADSLQPAGNVVIGRQIEHLAALSEAGVDLSELTEGLSYRLENPVNLNEADKRELQSLVFLSDIQIKNLLDYRKKYGTFLSIYELKVIDGLGRVTLQKILPFVVVAPPREKTIPKKALLHGKHDLIFRYQRKLVQAAGYLSVSDSVMRSKPGSYYLGDPSRIYLRYRYQVADKLSFAIISEKDPGEEFLNSPYGMDFYSFHLAYKTEGLLKHIVAGDYHARFGQGLVLWSGLSFSGGMDPSSLKRYAPGLRPNTSANENMFFRGGAFSLGFRRVELSILYSNNKEDANIVFNDSNDLRGHVSSLLNSGYHRSLNELEDKNSLSVQHMGGHISYSANRFKVGSTMCYSKYSHKIEREVSPSNHFRFSGQENFSAGIDYDILLRKTNIFGELAASKNGGWALLAGLTHTTDNGSIFGLLVREYRPQFQNLLAGATGKRDNNANERGIRLLTELPLFRRWSLQAALDHYSYPWITSGHINTLRVQDHQLRLIYSPSYTDEISLKYKYRSGTDHSDYLQSWFQSMVRIRKHEVQVVARYLISPSFSTKLQAGYTLLKGLEEGYKSAGSFLLLDIYYHPALLPMRLSFRYALFNTDDYNSRLYAYENDVLYASSMPAYYGKGFRLYFLAKYSPSHWIDAWLRLSMTCFTDRNIISSGPEEIRGNKLPEIKFQIRLKL